MKKIEKTQAHTQIAIHEVDVVEPQTSFRSPHVEVARAITCVEDAFKQAARDSGVKVLENMIAPIETRGGEVLMAFSRKIVDAGDNYGYSAFKNEFCTMRDTAVAYYASTFDVEQNSIIVRYAVFAK